MVFMLYVFCTILINNRKIVGKDYPLRLLGFLEYVFFFLLQSWIYRVFHVSGDHDSS